MHAMAIVGDARVACFVGAAKVDGDGYAWRMDGAWNGADLIGSME
jgi:hypothetical protein